MSKTLPGSDRKGRGIGLSRGGVPVGAALSRGSWRPGGGAEESGAKWGGSQVSSGRRRGLVWVPGVRGAREAGAGDV